MAVDKGQASADRYPAALRDHDERVEVQGWTYYIRGVRSKSELTGGSTVDLSGAGPALDFLAVLVQSVLALRTLRRPWTVGVVRLGSARTWNDPAPRVVHLEQLATGVEPTARIAELVAAVRAGRFYPR